jgi:hypothetical protein
MKIPMALLTVMIWIVSHFATADTLKAIGPDHPSCGVQGDYFYGRSGNKVQLYFHWHTPPGVRLNFDNGYDKIADLDYPQKQSGFVKLTDQLIDQDRAAAQNKNWDAVAEAKMVRNTVDSGQIEWFGSENPTDDESFNYSEEKKELIRMQGVFRKYQVPQDKAERALILLTIPSKYGYLTSSKAPPVPLIRVDLPPAELKDAPQIFSRRDQERAAIGTKLSPTDNAQFREISEKATLGIGQFNLLGPEIDNLKNRYPDLTGNLSQFAEDAHKVDSINQRRNREMAQDIFSQSGNGFVSLGDAHRRGVEKSLEDLCNSNDVAPIQTMNETPVGIMK